MGSSEEKEMEKVGVATKEGEMTFWEATLFLLKWGFAGIIALYFIAFALMALGYICVLFGRFCALNGGGDEGRRPCRRSWHKAETSHENNE
jgi:hypothetical protein